MTAEDFAAWLSAISEMSDGQRAEARATLESGAAGEAETGLEKSSRRGRREDALGTSGVKRVAAQGCPHCASREIVGWGRSDGLLRYRCKACRRTFNALTKTPMARLRKKEKWLDHARAMIEGRTLAKTAELCAVHPATAFRWRHRFLRAPSVNKPRTLRGIVEADETFILESFKGHRSDLRRAGEAARPGIRGAIRTIFPSSSPATGRAQPSTPFCRRSPAPPSAPRSPES
jgi:transposase-like protein